MAKFITESSPGSILVPPADVLLMLFTSMLSVSSATVPVTRVSPAKNHSAKLLKDSSVSLFSILESHRTRLEPEEIFPNGQIRHLDSAQAAFPDHPFIGRANTSPCSTLAHFTKIPFGGLD